MRLIDDNGEMRFLDNRWLWPRKAGAATCALMNCRVEIASRLEACRRQAAALGTITRGPPFGDPQVFALLLRSSGTGLTGATRHAALHAASAARPGELCAASHAAASRPSGPQRLTPSAS